MREKKNKKFLTKDKHLQYLMYYEKLHMIYSH